MARRLRSVDGLVAPGLAETLAVLELGPEDAALVALAKQYAASIDFYGQDDPRHASVLRMTGPKLADVEKTLRERSREHRAMAGKRHTGALAALRAARMP